MYIGALEATSNREDWRQAYTLVDADTGEIIDISLCEVTLTLRNAQSKAVALKGSIATGEVTLPEAGTFQWTFPASQMSGLCAGQYEVGVRIAQDSSVAQLIIATVDVMEGIDTQ